MKNKSGEKTEHLTQGQMYLQVKSSDVLKWRLVWVHHFGEDLYNPKCFITKLKLQNNFLSLILYLSDEYIYTHYFSRNESEVDNCCMLLNSYFVFCSYWFTQTSIFIMHINILGSINDTDVFLIPKCSSFHGQFNTITNSMFLFRGKDFLKFSQVTANKVYTKRWINMLVTTLAWAAESTCQMSVNSKTRC